MKVKLLSQVQLLATPWTAAYQAPLSMGFSRQEYWSGVPLPSPTTGKTIALTRQTFVGKVMFLLFNMLSQTLSLDKALSLDQCLVLRCSQATSMKSLPESGLGTDDKEQSLHLKLKTGLKSH